MTVAFQTTPAPPDFAPRYPRYRLVDLGEDEDGSALIPVAINDEGQMGVVARSNRIIGAMSGFQVANGLRLPASVAFGQDPVTCISRSGHVAGAGGVAPKALNAWASHFGDFGSQVWPQWSSVARGINSAGEVVGDVLCEAGRFTLSRAFILSSIGRFRLLSPPEGGTTSAAAINDSGVIALNAVPLGAPSREVRAWCLIGQSYFSIPGFGGGFTRASALTEGCRVVGSSMTVQGELHAFLWEEGKTTDVGGRPGCDCEALGAADTGAVVGRVLGKGMGSRAFISDPKSGFRFLDECVDVPSGWSLLEARGINFHGQIVGKAAVGGRWRGFVLHPILPS